MKININSIVAYPLAVMVGIFTGFLVSAVISDVAFAEATKKLVETKTTKPVETKSTQTTKPVKPDTQYTYVAQPGDSYSKMARKAVQTYGINNKVNLSQSRIIFAETNLTLEAGSPELVEGQTVKINKATVKSWVDKAKALSNDKAAKWDKYTVGVNFNTNNVGEKR